MRIVARKGEKKKKMNTLLGEVGKLWREDFSVYIPSLYNFASGSETAMLNDVLYARYRIALKFRKLQKSLLCKCSVQKLVVQMVFSVCPSDYVVRF